MAYSLYAEKFENSDFSGAPRVYQPFVLPRLTKLKAIRTWFLWYNNPTFTTLSMLIKSNKNGVPTDTLFTFNKTWTLAEIRTAEAYGAKEIYFDFTEAKWLKEDTVYHLVPSVSGASFSAASHLSWVRGFPDPNLESDVTVDLTHINRVPFLAAFIGDDR